MSDQKMSNGPIARDSNAPGTEMADNSSEAIDDTAVDDEVEEEQTAKSAEPDEEERGEEGGEKSDQRAVDDPKPRMKKRKNLIRTALEYDVSDMYPEMSILAEKRKSEWDYQDPETIRALWLESKTNALAEWKVRYLTIKKQKKPRLEVRETTASTLRVEHLKNKDESRKNARQLDLTILARGRESPRFDEVKLPTNVTTDMRYKYRRNNPPVPRYYLEHFEKHKKPPFKINAVGGPMGCKPLYS